ncbi:Cation/H(+) antiporter 15 [Nymphaea thermarum]|nr:Cation/H(+) antiporter 15 [Nymphaea thermarum]
MGCATQVGAIVLLGQAISVLLVFQVVHFFIRRIGQPRVISEILTGMLVGTVLSRIGPLGGEFEGASREVLGGVAKIGRTLYMFMIGLELDPAFLWQSSKRASLIMASTLCVSTVISLAFTPLVMDTLKTKIGYSRFVFLFTVIIAGTSAPTAIRAAAELKLATTDIGRLAITTSILSDMVVLLLVGINPGPSSVVASDIVHDSSLLVICLIVTLYVCRPVFRWLNRRNHGREINNFQFGVLIMGLLCLTMSGSEGSSEEIFFALFLGLAFPKTGKLGRSVVRRMRSPVHELLLPLLFAYGSMQADVRNIHGRDVGLVFATVVLSLVGKILGTTCVCRLLGIPWAQTTVMGLLLNVKGQVDLIILSRTVSTDKAEQEVLLVAILSAIINTVITPSMVMAIVKFERHSITGYKAVGLELLPPESEMRMLTAAHMTASLPSLLSLVEGIRGPFAFPTSVYFMQLIELTDSNASTVLQAEQDTSSSLRGRPVSLDPADSSVNAAAVAAIADYDEDENSGTTLASETRQIEMALNSFWQTTGISIRHVKAISGFSNMHEDICNGAEDLRASIIIMPFHKQQMVDGGMETVNEGHHSVNEKVLRHARCTVGILIDRGLGLAAQAPVAPGLLYQVGVLFFGGPDDREALAYAARMLDHPGVNLTVVRFLPSNEEEYGKALEMQAAIENKVMTKIREHERERAADNNYVAQFYTRYVAAGSVSYLEKYVANCVETANAMDELQSTYHLLLVGKGSSEGTPLTAGMADWVECPELGHIGDLLSSTDFGYPGSVLVVQQCRNNENAEDEDDFA